MKRNLTTTELYCEIKVQENIYQPIYLNIWRLKHSCKVKLYHVKSILVLYTIAL